ncbi:GNAT family N-acetyltransferase [Rhodanobacter denitrificans]|uniref:GNAT family N-acetyltransferase n=1 Tax=Rhodanobacter denitrificans TaxID=666685 RepID=UPI001F3425EA|nr:GNAT family N-acetyltransferase [Rhodanobacter denitrificans]UJJ60163.1 GNAT family N-acetyltransferase [Rhodanobacter denitrificans]
MRTYTTSIDIEAPAELVWRLLSDVLSWPQRLPTVTSVEPLGNSVLVVGARFHVVQPKVRPAIWEVASVEAGRSFVWRSQSPGLRMVANHAVDPIGGSRCRLRLDFAFAGILGRVAALFAGALAQRYIAIESQTFKELAEAAHHGSPTWSFAATGRHPVTRAAGGSAPALGGKRQHLDIHIDSLESPEVLALLREHLDSIAPTAPAESRHALDLGGLRSPDVTFWSIWDGPLLAGFGALKHLDASHAEIKSMRTAASHLRRGVASRLLQHLIQEAVARDYSRLSLETGSMAFFEAARRLYASAGFVPCPPFGSYQADPNSVFMTKQLR